MCEDGLFLNYFYFTLNFISHLCLLRNIIRDSAQVHNGPIAELRKLKKLCTNIRKAELNLQLFKNCQSFNNTPKFLSFHFPHAINHDTKSVRKRLLRGDNRKRNHEIHYLDANLAKLSSTLRNHLSSLEWYILKSPVNRNVEKFCKV